jgi:3-methyl-2-oxobutanoate hydroxymethyltransferase
VALPVDLAKRITSAVSIPTIGIGAGPHCDGQVLVCYDFLGMFKDVQPKFVKRYAEIGDAISKATKDYVADVQSGAFPEVRHSFGAAQPKAAGEPTGETTRVEGAPPTYGPAEE